MGPRIQEDRIMKNIGRPKIKFDFELSEKVRGDIHAVVKRRCKSKSMRKAFFKGKDLSKFKKDTHEALFVYAMMMWSAYEFGRNAGRMDLDNMVDACIAAHVPDRDGLEREIK